MTIERERIEVFSTGTDEWRWRRVDKQGKTVLSDSGLEAYASPRGASAAAEMYNPKFDPRDIEVLHELEEASDEQAAHLVSQEEDRQALI